MMDQTGLPQTALVGPSSIQDQHQPYWGVHLRNRGNDGAAPLWQAALWAPDTDHVTLVLQGERYAMHRGTDGRHLLEFSAPFGAEYGFDLGAGLRPDPAARRQADGVHGPSVLVDPHHAWPASEDGWSGRPWDDAVILEIHIGLFTPEGTFAAAASRLRGLADLGITAVEIMPVAQFSGTRGWGYDGVLPYAPHGTYGTPTDMKAFVATAHALGIAVILDVVYNHFGPDGAYLHEIAPGFFDAGRSTPWGAGIDYTRPAVRDFFLSNVAMWIGDFHIDGLRIDAAHQIRDPSDPELLTEIARTARVTAGPRTIWLVLEDERNLTWPTQPVTGPYDAQWNDDYHHALHCLLTGEDESYYAPFAADPLADLLLALREGQVDQGQPRPGGASPRGMPSAHLPVTAFVNSNQTHDQIGNRAHGDRLISLVGDEAAWIAHALLLTAPFIPMLFMGEEAGETAPFCFFADLPEPLASATRKGRQAEFSRFSSFSGKVPDPMSRATFDASRPYLGQADRLSQWRDWTSRLVQVRRDHVLPLIRSGRGAPTQAKATGARSLSVLWRFAAGELLINANLGSPPDTPVPHVPQPEIAVGNIDTDPFAFTLSIRPAS
ncbi:malto-oligosyltrehalose trehalohydrolase [Puniceibacterium sp. HSS470]|nr:malto-oligosyltrehalose trehalohydrolase [Puniceibacterium sp. HSS470]|tara:strand:+ start:100052 stop:101869 length:1818 start_codon:yes stop_codon:yes gene_type:complete